LGDFPRQDWPPVVGVHLAFEAMIAAGSALMGVALWGAWLLIRRRSPADRRPFLVALTLCAPLGLFAVEAGWCVTELGRQPWIIHDVMRVRDSVTPMPGLTLTLGVTVLLYLVLGSVVLVLLRRHVLSAGAPSE
jgi:cytochrome d ubiquinol oxidase subunit I